MQVMAFNHDGVVEKRDQREDGQFTVKVDTSCPLFDGLDAEQSVLLTHGDSVVSLGEGWKVTATSGDLISAISCESRSLYGVQFHPEVDLSVNGKQMLENFLYKVALFKGDFTMEDRHQKALDYITSRVGDKKVLVLVSGGVDSSVCAALLNEALGSERVIPLHIDNGFMRKGESQKVVEALSKIGMHVTRVDASQDFYNATTEVKNSKGETYIAGPLNKAVNPEEKRKIIGDTFMRVAQREIEKLNLKADEVFLAQGTLRPDMIESGSAEVSSVADTIKTHHNDTNLVRELRALGRVIEPLSDYHKDEVRDLGRQLGLPEELVIRHPFPGPGLSVRIICAQEPYICDTFESTNQLLKSIVSGGGSESEVVTSSLKPQEVPVLKQIQEEKKIRATLLPFKTVGVQGDGRTYSHPCALTSTDEKPDWVQLFMLAKLIPRLCHNVNRVVYVFGSTLEKEYREIVPVLLTPENIALLQEADGVVNKVLLERNQVKCIAQAPVILFPFGEDEGSTQLSIALRTIITNDFMTGSAAQPGIDICAEAISEIAEKVLAIPGVKRFAYDLTSKPPATTEWE
eukprot:TRINITY_DN3024_c0_g1_i1.p1 TRINITY_DN3024_c0_g1~~TRINITY_DN3024_c0_g1_i1.p1  ORF type:complete len:665 (-),score=136.96 TRINITY_DN3024_c0_g1_i1:50-1768(-)